MLKTHADRLDAALDEALTMTFPASDPIAVHVGHDPRSPIDDDDRPSASNAN